MAVAIGILLVVAGTAWIALIMTIALLFSAAGILDNWAFVAGALVLGLGGAYFEIHLVRRPDRQ